MKKIAVIGLGYVGLPLALLAEKKGFSVIGLEVDKKRLAELKQGKSPIDDPEAASLLPKSKITFTGSFSDISSADAAIICVPTPVHEDKTPDLSIVKKASVSAAKNLPDDALLIVESTINPGVCDELLIPNINKETNHTVGETLGIAHCPERINPGDTKWNVENINRVLGADSPKSLEKANTFYSKLTTGTVKKMGSLKEAEAVKIVENSFRDINIAFVNELAISFEKIGINIVNVIEGASTKPFAFMPHYPGIGVGGHCIPVDPYYLIEYARGLGFEHDFLKLARSINENMPLHAINKIEQLLIEQKKATLKDTPVTLLGLSYKANVGDKRESPSLKIQSVLRDRGAKLTSYDPHIPEDSDAETLKDALKDAEVIILATDHSEFKEIDIAKLNKDAIFLDGRNFFRQQQDQFAEHGVHYLGIGV